jgi:glycosyltransferase involved in cell wall biosynthesis
MKPKASFVIPAYNAEAYLAETLESTLKQTIQDVEVIVVNDGSTDNTNKVIDYYQGKDSRVIGIMQENQGRSASRNRGILASRADYIFTLDADDLAYKDRVAETLSVFKKTKADIVYSSFHMIDAISQIIDTPVLALPFDYERVKKEWFTYICHSSMAFKKKVFSKVQYSMGDFDKHCIDDWKFQIDSFHAGMKFACSKKVLAAYRYIPKERDEAKIKELKASCLK